MEWWNAAVTEDADNGWFPHDEALQRLVLDKKADIGDLFPAVASEVTYASKGARGSAATTRASSGHLVVAAARGRHTGIPVRGMS